MAGAIGVAAVLRARLVDIRCPFCGHIKAVERKPAACRICPSCRRQFPDPLSPPPKRR